MKNICAILFTLAILFISADASAQSRREKRAIKRPERTSGAQAAYGVSTERKNWAPKKKAKSRKSARKRPAKGTQAKAGKSYRRGGSGPKFFPTF
jgi:hypothetical protein